MHKLELVLNPSPHNKPERVSKNIVFKNKFIIASHNITTENALNVLLMTLLQWNLSVMTTEWDISLPSGAHLGGPWPPRWAPEGRNCSQE